MPTPRSRQPNGFAIAALVCLAVLSFEFFVFDRIGARHHTWVYPRWNDQIQYLTECYLGWENARAHGIVQGLYAALINPSAQGTLHDFWTILIFSVAGPSRSAALSLNIFALFTWQFAVFASVWRASRSLSLALIAIGLLLTLQSPWLAGPGSAFDFRLDWPAAATMGVCLVAAENTDAFIRRGASLLFGVSVAWVLLTRFLTGTYFILIYFVFAIWVLRGPDAKRRFLNLIGSGLIATLLAGPIFWLNRTEVYQYYLIGHFTGPESAIRSRQMGLWKSTDWLLQHVWHQHVGSPFIWAIVLVAIASLVIAMVWPRSPGEKDFGVLPRRTSSIPAWAFALCPAVVLILHKQKSEFVLGIMLAGVFGLLWHPLYYALRTGSDRALRPLACIVVGLSLYIYCSRLLPDPHSEEFARFARHVNTLADYIADRATAAKLEHPTVAVDRVTDCLDAQVLRVLCYERKHRWIAFVMTLPTGIEATDPQIYWDRLKHSDFVFLTETGDNGSWPYDRQLAGMRSETLSWARANLRWVDEIASPPFTLALFERTALTENIPTQVTPQPNHPPSASPQN